MSIARLLMLFARPVPTWRFNPADKSASVTLSASDGVMTVAGASFAAVRGTTGVTTGKHYIEYIIGADATDLCIGFGNPAMGLGNYVGADPNGIGYAWDGRLLGNGVTIHTYAAYTVGDIVQIAIDSDGLKGWIGKNNVWQNGDPGTGTGGQPLGPATAHAAASARNGGTCAVSIPLRYAPPTGYIPL